MRDSLTLMIKFTEEELNTILRYSDSDAKFVDLTEEQIMDIEEKMKEGIRNRILDEPHYAYDDYFVGVVQ